MAENEEAQGLAESAGEAPEELKDAAGGGEDGVSENGDGGGLMSKKLLIPAVAAGVAALGYGAKKVGPKLVDSLSTSAADKAEDAAQSTLEKAEDQGGITGMGAKMLRNKAGGGDDDGEGGLLSTITSPFKGSGSEPSEGWGKGRRNPIQLVADVAVPIDTAYNQWTQLEEFPKFMHRVTSVQQDDDDPSKVKWQEKIWFSKRQWEAEITEQIPNERIKWRTVSGTKHVGHVTFHELGDNLTRVTVNIDFQPSGMFEKMASGLRFVKRAAKSDLYRYKAFIETHGEPTGAWRGRIENGEVVEDAEVEEGKPFEEGAELRRPESSDQKGQDEQSESDEDDDGDDAELERRRAEREERRAGRQRERSDGDGDENGSGQREEERETANA